MISERIPLWEGREDVALHTMLRKCNPLPMQTEPVEDLPAGYSRTGGDLPLVQDVPTFRKGER